MSSPEARNLAAGAGRRSASLLIVATVAAGIALDFAQEIFIPIALGLLLAALFRPVVRVLSRSQIPAPATATLVVLICLRVFGTSVFLLFRPVKAWVSEAPATLAAARGKLEKLRRPIKQVSRAVEQVQKEVTGGEGKSRQAQAAPPSSPASFCSWPPAISSPENSPRSCPSRSAARLRLRGAFAVVAVLAAVKVFADRSSRDSRLAAILDE